MTARRIITQHVCPPLPIRGYREVRTEDRLDADTEWNSDEGY